jgi:thiamine monophosphate synthase
MPTEKTKKRKSPTVKKAATVVLAAGIGMALVLDHDEKHIELRDANTNAVIALLTDGAIVATSTAVTTVQFSAIPPKQFG